MEKCAVKERRWVRKMHHQQFPGEEKIEETTLEPVLNQQDNKNAVMAKARVAIIKWKDLSGV